MKSVGLSGYSMTNKQLKLNKADRACYSDMRDGAIIIPKIAKIIRCAATTF
jgi:hypothetical protein